MKIISLKYRKSNIFLLKYKILFNFDIFCLVFSLILHNTHLTLTEIRYIISVTKTKGVISMEIMIEKIKLLMTKEKLTIKSLAEATGIKYSTLRDFLAGKTNKLDINKLFSIAKALKCDSEYLTNDNITEFIPLSESNKKLYYLDEEAAEYAQEIARDKDLKMLFKASKTIKKEDMQLVYEMVKRFKNDAE